MYLLKFSEESPEKVQAKYALAKFRGCPQCNEEPVMATRNLHLVAIEETKKIWAPCGVWMYGCNDHPAPKARYYGYDDECPHGRGLRLKPQRAIPLVGHTAIILDDDLSFYNEPIG
jgi:hypothetical protein